ncbi:hypothetical protein ILYODFUR_030290 [Ilyodon furcidens]|uniref:Uncharacterized protein n=1 Tax=Ilyodon furcidens TaxID=33524 RepID=A0ABV0SSZ1_9TELE
MAQDTLEGLCLSAGLGTPWDSPQRAGGGVRGKGRLHVSTESAAPATEFRMKRKTMSTSTIQDVRLSTQPNQQSVPTRNITNKEYKIKKQVLRCLTGAKTSVHAGLRQIV